MIGMLTGRVESVETDTALIDVGGVGYEVRMTYILLSIIISQKTYQIAFCNIKFCITSILNP